MRKLSLCLLLVAALLTQVAWGEESYDKVLFLDPPLATSCLAVEIQTPPGSSLSGLRWFHNDAQVAFPKLVLMEGDPAQGPDLSNSALILLEIVGASLAWGEVDFEGPVTSSTGTAYAVFFFPEAAPTPGLGAGPGIGIKEEPGVPFYLTGTGTSWVRFDPSFAIGVEPVYSSGKTAPRLLKDLQQELATEGERVPEAPLVTQLLAPRPNPFNPRVELAFTLAEAGQTELVIFDLRGRQIATLQSGLKPAGQQSLVWDGKDSRGRAVSSGVYFARLRVGELTFQRRLALVR